MKWRLTLTVWWMNFASLLAHWMLSFGNPDSVASSLAPAVRVLNKNGSIVRSSPGVTPSLWPPLVAARMNTGKPSTTWLLLVTTKRTWDAYGSLGEEPGEEAPMWCTLSFQEPARGPNNDVKMSNRSRSGTLAG